MADNVTVDNGGLTDYSVSSDEGSGGQVQRVKLAMSADGSETHVPADADGLLTQSAAQHDEDAAHADGDSGQLLLAVRNNDGETNFTDADGDYSPIAVDRRGRVQISDESGAISVDIIAPVALLADRVEDSAHDSGNLGQFILAVRNDAAATTLTDTDGDYSAIAVDDRGRVIVSDGGDTISVDGSVGVSGAVAVTQSGTWDEVGINDSGNSITVDATDLDIRDLTTTDEVTVKGAAAHASPASGNPVYVAGRASAVVPTDVGADGDAAAFWTNRSGATMVAMAPHIGLNGDPWSLVHEAAQYTSTQTSTVLVAGGASEKLVVTKVQIQVGGTTAGTMQLYFGTSAYSRGTSRAIFDGEFAPSATLKPGVVMDGPFISGTNGDDLLVTTSAAINPLTINVWYYVVT